MDLTVWIEKGNGVSMKLDFIMVSMVIDNCENFCIAKDEGVNSAMRYLALSKYPSPDGVHMAYHNFSL